MLKKHNREHWQRIFQNNNTLNASNSQDQPPVDKSIPMLIATLFFGLTGLAFLVLQIIFVIIGTSLQNHLLFGCVSGVCFLICIIYFFVLRDEKKKMNSRETHHESSNNDSE